MQPFSAAKICEKVYWVGAIDWNIRDFHGYKTSLGTTYNAFLIIADKVVLVDTVKDKFGEEMFSRIDSVLGSRKIDYIISNHSELDHSGVLPKAIERYKPQKIFASEKGVKALLKHFSNSFYVEALRSGDKLDLGNEELIFLETPMIHWPDSMMSYLVNEKILFSQDGFGMHLASSERFCDEINENIIYLETSKYFANILLPLANLIIKKINEILKLKLEIKIVAPDHGPIWRYNITSVFDNYLKWAEQKPNKKVVLTYDTMWGSTEIMARSICDGLVSGGMEVKLMPISSNHRSDVATELLECGSLIVGSPTINNEIFPSVADILTYLKGLKPKNLIAASFGSYGWSGQAPKIINQMFSAMNLKIVENSPLLINYVPNKEELLSCREYGLRIAEEIERFIKSNHYKEA